MKIPGKSVKTNEIVWVDIEESFIKMITYGGEITVETDEGSVVLPQTIVSWAEILSELGCIQTDRNSIVKIDRIDNYNEAGSNVSLKSNGKPVSPATVSKPRSDAVKDSIQQTQKKS